MDLAILDPKGRENGRPIGNASDETRISFVFGNDVKQYLHFKCI
jgi:hypothetical protein